MGSECPSSGFSSTYRGSCRRPDIGLSSNTFRVCPTYPLPHKLVSYQRLSAVQEKGGWEAMKNSKQIFLALICDDTGQDMIEYAIMAALLGLGTAAALKGTK